MGLLEIEIKAYCDDLEKVRDAIAGLEGSFVSANREEDVYFNHPDRDFAATDEALRLRCVDGRILLTYKGPKISSRSKSRIEEEVCVDDVQSARKILEHLGFIESGSVTKERQLYRIGDIDVCLDSVSGLGDFVELEKKDAAREEVENRLFDLARELGLTRFERRSYL